MNDDEEFQKVRAAIETAADAMASVLGTLGSQGEFRWDYLVVAVPTGRKAQTTTVPMISSVPPETLPRFIDFLSLVTRYAAGAGRMIDDRRPEGEPS